MRKLPRSLRFYVAASTLYAAVVFFAVQFIQVEIFAIDQQFGVVFRCGSASARAWSVLLIWLNADC